MFDESFKYHYRKHNKWHLHGNVILHVPAVSMVWSTVYELICLLSITQNHMYTIASNDILHHIGHV